MSPTETYVSLYNNIISFAPISVFTLFLLSLFRLAPIIAISPFFGSKLPSPVKMGFCILLAIIFLPHLAVTSKTLLAFNLNFILLAFKELLIGFILAIFSAIPFFMAQTSGSLIDFARGASSLQVSDPFMQSQTSDIGILYNLIMIVMFYEMGGLTYFFDAVLGSYSVIPIDGWISPTFFSFNHPFWTFTWGLVTKIMAIAIQLAAPSLLAILMTELFLGIANRLAPQVQIAFLGMSLKSLVGLAMLAIAWFFIIKQFGVQLNLWLKEIPRIMNTFG